MVGKINSTQKGDVLSSWDLTFTIFIKFLKLSIYFLCSLISLPILLLLINTKNGDKKQWSGFESRKMTAGVRVHLKCDIQEELFAVRKDRDGSVRGMGGGISDFFRDVINGWPPNQNEQIIQNNPQKT